MEKSIFDPQHQSQSLDAKLIVALERIAEVFRVSLWEVGKQLKLSPLQIQLLIFLNFHKRELCKVSYLAIEFNLSKPTISEAIRTLAKKKLIEKETDPVDNRSYAVRLNWEGERVAAQVMNYANPLSDAFVSWSEEEKIQFYSYSLKLINNLQQMGFIKIQRTCFNCRFYTPTNNSHYCKFLERELSPATLRVDCPEFESR